MIVYNETDIYLVCAQRGDNNLAVRSVHDTAGEAALQASDIPGAFVVPPNSMNGKEMA